MVNFMKKIPAGPFLIPMLLSALVYTLWPNLFSIGGATEALLGSGHTIYLIGAITFFSGLGIDIKHISKLFQRHGVIFIVKFIVSVVISLLFISIFGQSGVLGISALAFTIAMTSMNPSLYISLVNIYGDDVDAGAFGLTGLFSIPTVPMLVYAFSGGGDIDWMPIISTLIPLLIGIILGNLDSEFRTLFGGGIGAIIPLLGWKVGYGLNLFEALQAGLLGILLTAMFYIFMTPLFFTDKKLLKNDGVAGLAMTAIAGTAASFPTIIAEVNPQLEPFVSSATAQILAASIITTIITPLLVSRLFKKEYGEAELLERQKE